MNIVRIQFRLHQPGRFAVIALLLWVAPLSSQAGTPSPKYDVIDIHPADPLSSNENLNYGRGRLSGKGVTVAFLVTTAFGVQPYQVSGLPSSLAGKKFDFEARLDDPATDPDPRAGADAAQKNIELTRSRIVAMLVDRFDLKFHVSQREATVFSLSVSGRGPNLQPGTMANPFIHSHNTPDGIVLELAGQDMPAFAKALSYRLGQQVIDRTELTGKYDFKLEYAPPEQADSNFPSITTALREQLGLTLKAQKGEQSVYVIDGIKEPTQN